LPQADTAFSSSEESLEQAGALARRLIEQRRLGRDSLVIEAGSKDGYLLRHYRDAGVPVLGIEPSRDPARIARHQHNILTREGWFTRFVAERLYIQGLRCDLFHAHDVLGRVADLNGFVHGIRCVLKDDGVAVIETPSVKDALTSSGPIDFSFAHLSLFSLTALCHCLVNQGLTVTDAERTSAPDGSLRVFVVHARPGVFPGERVVDILADEDSWGVRSPETYTSATQRAVA
jgi:SAM-dependent methyltransferase